MVPNSYFDKKPEVVMARQQTIVLLNFNPALGQLPNWHTLPWVSHFEAVPRKNLSKQNGNMHTVHTKKNKTEILLKQ